MEEIGRDVVTGKNGEGRETREKEVGRRWEEMFRERREGIEERGGQGRKGKEGRRVWRKGDGGKGRRADGRGGVNQALDNKMPSTA